MPNLGAMSRDEVTFMQSLGRAVRVHRAYRGWSQSGLARRAGMSRMYIGNIERGQVVPNIIGLHRVATALGVPLSTFFVHVERAQLVDDVFSPPAPGDAPT